MELTLESRDLYHLHRGIVLEQASSFEYEAITFPIITSVHCNFYFFPYFFQIKTVDALMQILKHDFVI